MAESTTNRLTSTNVGGKNIDTDETVITHCIFDMDGLLLNTQQISNEVTSEVLARFGKTYSLELKSRLSGLRKHESIVLLINETGIDMTPDEFNKEYEKRKRLVTHLKKHRIPIAVATNSSRENFNDKASNHRELFDMFDSVTCGDDVKNGKPAPDLFLAACEKMGNPPTNQCLVFEDTINGVKAAKNANMK
ncbi:8503_t:CDS:2, partial [Racocetra persica]